MKTILLTLLKEIMKTMPQIAIIEPKGNMIGPKDIFTRDAAGPYKKREKDNIAFLKPYIYATKGIMASCDIRTKYSNLIELTQANF
jgi:hypothetical protein